MGLFSGIGKIFSGVTKGISSFIDPIAKIGSSLGNVTTGISSGLDLFNQFTGGNAPPTGAQLGQSARDYYGAAFPGTNPWEQLGAGNPIGATTAAATQDKIARRQTGTARDISSKQIDAQLRMKAQDSRAKGHEIGLSYGDPSAGTAIGREIETGKPTGPYRGQSARFTGTKAQIDAVEVQSQLKDIRNEEVKAKIASTFGNSPAEAALAAVVYKVFREGQSIQRYEEPIRRYYDALVKGGAFPSWMSKLSIFGLNPNDVESKLRRFFGGKTSVPAVR